MKKIFYLILILFFVGFGCSKKEKKLETQNTPSNPVNEVIQETTGATKDRQKSLQNDLLQENKDDQVILQPQVTPQIEDKTKQEKQNEQKISVNLTINSGKTVQNFTLSLTKNATVYDLLDEAQKQGKISFLAKNYDFGAFIEEINGVKNSQKEKKYWMLYVNGKLSEVGASLKKLNGGDRVEWRYERQ